MNINTKGKVIWITGLSGSGKSTLGKKVANTLRNNNTPIIFLDGDELRAVFKASDTTDVNYGKKGRLKLAKQYSRLCCLLANQELTVIIATISMFKEIHEWNHKNLPNYFEVYLKVPIEELRQRDPKGVYKKFESGNLRNVAGLDLVVDEPENSHLIIEFNKKNTISDLANKIISKIKENNNKS